MHLFAFSLIVLLNCLGISKILGDAEYDGALTFTLEHTYDSGNNAEWTRRGTINVRNLKPGRASMAQSGGPSLLDIDNLKTAVKNNGVYRIRIPVKTSSSDSKSNNLFVSSFTPACGVYESRWTDYIQLHLDQSGVAIGLSIFTSPGSCHGRHIKDTDLSKYNTTVEMVQAVTGPIPDTQTYIEKMKREEMERAKGQQQDNRSFIAKYWMYIVPGLFILLLMSSMDAAQTGNAR